MANSLDGQVAVVTGGSRGIGRAFVALARRAGATTVCWDKTEPIEASDVDLFVQMNVASEQSVAKAMAKTLNVFDQLDILVNSAGIAGPVALMEHHTLDDWQRVLAINLTGSFLCCRAAIAPMRTRDYGRIVNVASVAGKDGNANQSGYSASKAGLIALTKSLGKELAATGIRVNCITPAITATDMIDQMTKDQVQLVLQKIPMGRLGQPEEIAELMLWMASPACTFSTGAIFDASGGRATY